jgi:lambda family phage portal protein
MPETLPALVHPTNGKPLREALAWDSAISRTRVSLSGTGSLTPYDAADPWSQELKNWHPWLGSPDTEGNPYRDFIVSRIRDLVRNDGWASGTVTSLLDNMIGAGFRFVSKPDWMALSRHAKGFDMQWAKEYQAYVQGEFRLWADDMGRNCDLGRRLSFREICRLGARTHIIENDAIAMMHLRPERLGRGSAQFATCVQVVDPDRLSNPNMMADQPNLRGGVEIDDDGAPIAYHFRRAHQAQWMEYQKSWTWERVPRETAWGRPFVIHYFESERADTHRGCGGLLRPVLSRLKMLSRYDSVELQAAIINAVLAAFIEAPYDPESMGSALEAQLTGGDVRNAQLGVYEDLRQGYHESHDLKLNGARIPRLFSGEKFNLTTPARPPAAFEAFEGAMIRNVASATGQSASQVSRDYSKNTYSGERAAMIEAWKSIGRQRFGFSHGFALPIIGCVIEEMHATRKDIPLPRKAPSFPEMRTAYCRSRLLGPGRGYIDPVKEAQAAVLRMDAGLTTLEDECSEQGLDYEEVLYQRAFERELFQKLGLPFPKWFGEEQATSQSENAQQLAQKPQAA